LVQVVAPVVEYLPAGHNEQLPPVPAYPGKHILHADDEVAPVAEVEPAGQFVQVVAPAVEYLPAGHIVQLPSVPAYPALQ
jgi:hypothetical protein